MESNPAINLADKAILIVDDMGSIRQFLRSILRENGCNKILEASNGVEALGIVKNNYIDMVVSDWNMPKMDGLELLQNIRDDEKIKETLFLMVTSESEKDSVVKAIQSTVDSYIVKPFAPATVFKQVVDTFKKQRRYK